MLNNRLKLDAIAWKAKSNGISYGQYNCQLTDYDRECIYKEYEQVLAMRKKEEKDRLELARLRRMGNIEKVKDYKREQRKGKWQC